MSTSFTEQLREDYNTPCGALTAADAAWPQLLQLAPNKPPKLYYAGNISLLNSQCLAIVGSRTASAQGLKSAEDFAACAAGRGITIVSGGALGCDQAAHKGALSVENGKTIAVMGCGLNKIYPRGADVLYREIVQKGGLLVSQYEPYFSPTQWSFVVRNSVIAGLAQATLVVEAAQKSGTFSTADATLAQGKDVLAIPGSIYAQEFSGSNQLIVQGATPIVSEESFIDAIEYIFNCNRLPFAQNIQNMQDGSSISGDRSTNSNKRKDCDKSFNNQHKIAQLSPLEQRIYKGLLNNAMSLEAIQREIAQTNNTDDKADSSIHGNADNTVTPVRLNTIMSNLELQELVIRGNDGRYQGV